MRNYLNAILTFIGTGSLTDEEFDAFTLEDTNDQLLVYNALVELLESREAVSETSSRLQYYFLAKGVSVSTEETPSEGSSNILVGSCL